MYCLGVTNNYSRFTWAFFLASKDETSAILKSFITGMQNLVDHKAKVIRCDNKTEFKNSEMNQFCEMKVIMRQYSASRTPQQNGIAERRNRTLIEAARTMLADSKLPTTFWAEVVNIACYVQNRVLVVKPHKKNPYELFHGKFNGKANEEFFIGYSMNSKAFRVFNSRKRIVEENLHIRFSENTPNVIGTQSNGFACTKACENAGQARTEKEHVKDYILLPLWTADPPFSQDSKSSQDDGFQPLNMSALEDISTFNFSSNHEDDDEMADMNNLDTTIQASPNTTTRIHKDHSLDQVIEDLHLTTQTRNMSKNLEEHGFVTTINQRKNHKDLQTVYLLAFYNKMNPKRLFLAFASFKDFVVYHMDVKSAFLYEKIEEDEYVCQPPRFEDPDFPDKLYKVEKALYGLHQAPRAWFTEVKNASTPMETQKPLLKDEDVCACARYQVNLKVSHLHDVKRIFSDYDGASLDMKSTTEGCQFLGCRLISWQCNKQKVVANSTTEAKYVDASNCCGQYALTVNPTVYTLCIEQFWATVKVKTITGEVQLQALVDGKKVIITESTVKRDLQLEDTEGVNCLPNAAIFEQLTLIGTMTFAIICLATNQKFNFLKYIFKSMVENLDNVNKLLTYPRVGKGFSGRETPLFQTMMVQAQEEMGEGLANPIDPHHTPNII
nr:hypothetical protein [Tanacetum cinerariifolium]